MKDSDYKNLYTSLVCFATKEGHAQLAEDFAQEAIIAFSQPEYKSRPWKFHLIDFLRKHGGRKGSAKYKAQYQASDSSECAADISMSFNYTERIFKSFWSKKSTSDERDNIIFVLCKNMDLKAVSKLLDIPRSRLLNGISRITRKNLYLKALQQ